LHGALEDPVCGLDLAALNEDEQTPIDFPPDLEEESLIFDQTAGWKN
jgi:hypothetical protein